MKIKFVPQNVEVEVKPGQSVLNVAQENGISIRSVCKGVPSCAECRVGVVEGINNVLPPMDPELDLIGTAHFVENKRLACQMRCFGDMVIDLQEHVDKGMGTVKQPRGSIKKETTDSSARMGNVLEESEAPVVEIEMTEEEKKEAQNLKLKSEKKQSKKKKSTRHAGSSNSDQKKKSSSSKNRNRNRNRNRNKKSPQPKAE